MSSIINATLSNGLSTSADNSGEIELQSNGTTALKVNTNEGIQILNCLGVGNATPSTSGAGITFPATRSASSNANTLDDYEEGTWTPGLRGTGGSAGSQAYQNQSGRYIRIGRFVLLTGYLTLSNKGSWTNDVEITGFPFAVENTTQDYSAHCFYYGSVTLPALTYGFGAYGIIGETRARCFTNGNTGFVALDNYSTQIQNSSQIGPWQFCYYTTD
jgi:hypothetical protein